MRSTLLEEGGATSQVNLHPTTASMAVQCRFPGSQQDRSASRAYLSVGLQLPKILN